MKLKEKIAKWIREARTEADLSGAELGTKLALELGESRGNSRANISHWETEKHEPSLQQIVGIVKITGKGLPDDVLADLAGRGGQAAKVELAPSGLNEAAKVAPSPPRLTMTIKSPEAEVDAEQHIGARHALTWLDRLDETEATLIAIYRESEGADRATLIDQANLLPAAQNIGSLLFRRNKL
ncbi:MAG TPA: helix-turn-helix transcriptional regulator [Telluria sp.]|jgi:transcriptional regulator with XRE-family HTH domain